MELLTTAELTALGLTKACLDTAVRRGELVRERRGVFSFPEGIDAGADVDAVQRHLADVAAELRSRPAWLAARRSAALVHQLPIIGQTPPARPQLLLPQTDVRTRPEDRHHRINRVPEDQQVIEQDLPCSSLARTAVDLARTESFRNGVCALDGVLGRGVTSEEVLGVLGGMRRWPGATRARVALQLADGRSESLLESLSRVSVHQLGLPAPEPQLEVWLGEQFLARVDFGWEELGTLGEADGLAKFGDEAVDREKSFASMRDRQAWLEDVGFIVVRWGWNDAWRPKGVLDDRLLRAFARAEGRRLDPRVRLVRTTVADRLARDRRTAA